MKAIIGQNVLGLESGTPYQSVFFTLPIKRCISWALLVRRARRYQIQAAIAALHASAESANDTDWPQIAALYGELARIDASPIIELNRAVAVGSATTPGAGLALIDAIDASGELGSYHFLHAARADLLRRDGRAAEAADAYRAAISLTTNDVERAYLRLRLAEVLALV